MKEIEIIVTSPRQKALVAKLTRPILPSLSIADILRRVEIGEPLFQWKWYTADHDVLATALVALCDALDANGVDYLIMHKLIGVSLAGEPLRDLVERIDKATLLRMLKRWEEIGEEQLRISELEEGY